MDACWICAWSGTFVGILVVWPRYGSCNCPIGVSLALLFIDLLLPLFCFVFRLPYYSNYDFTPREPKYKLLVDN